MTTTLSEKPDWALSKRERANAQILREGGTVRRRKRWPYVVGLIVVSVGCYAAFQFGRPAATETEAALPPVVQEQPIMRLALAEVKTLAPTTLTRSVKVTGSLQPLRQAALTAQVAGIVEAVNFRAGDTIKAGDVIAQIDVSDLEITLNQVRGSMNATRAQLDLAQTQFDTAKKLVDRGISPSSSLDSAKSNLDALQANLTSLQAQVQAAEVSIAKATIVAPFSGMVSSRSIEPNQSIASGAALVTLVDLSRMEVQAIAPLNATSSLAIGQNVELKVESDRNRVFKGIVDRINPVAVPGTRSIIVYVTLQNDDGFLRGGMFTSGNVIVAEKENAIAVPAGALREDQEGQYVLKIDGNTGVRQSVALGETWGSGLVEIVDGLSAGDLVVSAPLPQLEPGMQVSVAER